MLRAMDTDASSAVVPAARLLASRLHVDARETVRLQAVETAEGCVLSDPSGEGTLLRPVAAARLPLRPDACMVLLDEMRAEDDSGPGDAREAKPYLGLVHWMFGGVRLRRDDPWLVVCPSVRILGKTTPMMLFDHRASLPCGQRDFDPNPLVRAEGIANKPQAVLVLERRAGETDPNAEGDNDKEDDEEDDEGEGDEDEDDEEDDEEAGGGGGGVADLMEDDEEEEDDDDGMDGEDDDDGEDEEDYDDEDEEEDEDD